jgi:hypothetical protein
MTIAILTVPDRIDKYAALIHDLNKQIREGGLKDIVQLVTIGDTMEMSVGDKREVWKYLVKGMYLFWLDDDDKYRAGALKLLAKACTLGRDAVTFCGDYIEADTNQRYDFIIRKGYKNEDDWNNRILKRAPNHISGIRTELARQCVFPSMNVSEDSEYAKQINKLIQSEVHINEKIYDYHYSATNSLTANRG